MKILLPIFLFAFCTAVLSQTQSSPSTGDHTSDQTEKITTETDPPSTTDATSSTSVETTTHPTTVPSTTSNSTVETTSISPSPAPTTVTSPSPVTTTKAPEPDECTFNTTCIQAKLQAKFVIDIEDTDYTVNLGCNTTKEYGYCSSNETQQLSLVADDNTYNLTLIFEKNEDKSVFIRNVSFTYNLPEGKGAADTYSDNLLKVKGGNSYLCKSKFDIKMENVTMKISFIRIQAFLENYEEFGKAEECEADDKVSDIVPIAVGVALAALIIIVLIAYLVGRRRSRQKGYQSV